MSSFPVPAAPVAQAELTSSAFLAFAIGLCQDAGLSLAVGGRSWSYVHNLHMIVIPEDALTVPTGEALGILAHEVGHCAISRYHLFNGGLASPEGWSHLLNCIEDRRVEAWMATRYPGTRAWFDRLAVDRREPQPDGIASRFLLFCVAFLDGRVPTAAPAEVFAAFGRVAEARTAYVTTIPPADYLPEAGAAEVSEAYRHKVVPRMAQPETAAPDLREQSVRLSALAALELIESGLIGEAGTLWQADAEAIAVALACYPTRAQEVVLALSLRDGEAIHRLASSLLREPVITSPPPVSAGLRTTGNALFQEYIKLQVRPPPCGNYRVLAGPAAAASRNSCSPPGPHPQTKQAQRRYAEIVDEIKNQIASLRRTLEDVTPPAPSRWSQGVYVTGKRASLQAVMSAERDPRQRDRVWRRREVLERKKLAVSILVDLSGSMAKSQKIMHATRGCILLAETLRRLKVSFAVNGFQDELIPFVRFGQSIDDAVLAALADMPLETEGGRAGGRNHPEHNDDGPCLAGAAAALRAERADQRLMIVISDGAPAGRYSTAGDLRRAVADIAHGRPPMTLVGIGLGPGTDHVCQFYPVSRSNVAVDCLAEIMGELLRSAMLALRG